MATTKRKKAEFNLLDHIEKPNLDQFMKAAATIAGTYSIYQLIQPQPSLTDPTGSIYNWSWEHAGPIKRALWKFLQLPEPQLVPPKQEEISQEQKIHDIASSLFLSYILVNHAGGIAKGIGEIIPL